MSYSYFSSCVRKSKDADSLIIQPRMGFASPGLMREGLSSIKELNLNCFGTITLDSYTRIGDYNTQLSCLENNQELNGYPIVTHPINTTKSVLEGIIDENFPVQVRHGCPQPQDIFKRIVDIGLDSTEGGPVSYCLPYGRIPLEKSFIAWTEACRILADNSDQAHIESFGGCMLGQLCPPSMLIAIAILEGLYFYKLGVKSVSLSYAQGVSLIQDRAGLALLRKFAEMYLGDVDWHIVLYTYMGMFPRTESGAKKLIEDSAALAQLSSCERIIIKTILERQQIPTIQANLEAIEIVDSVIKNTERGKSLSMDEMCSYDEIQDDIERLLDTVLNLHSDISKAILAAFKQGLLDIPYCLHPDNCGRALSVIDERGFLCWVKSGNLPIKNIRNDLNFNLTSSELLNQIHYIANKYDWTSSTESLNS